MRWILPFSYGALLTRTLLAQFPWITLGGPRITAIMPSITAPSTHEPVTSFYLHFGAYGIWAILTYYAAGPLLYARRVKWIISFFMIHGAICEVLQYFFIPNRWASVEDMIGNTAGAMVASVLLIQLPSVLRLATSTDR